jgi:CubicO group peptidase (beta-lactamase class C family)/beta-lactamase regulating signal transducer with metallopeptidase domain
MSALSALALMANAVWQGALLACGGWLVARLLTRQPAVVRYVHWVVVLCAVMLLPFAPELKLPSDAGARAEFGIVTEAPAPGIAAAQSSAPLIANAPEPEEVRSTDARPPDRQTARAQDALPVRIDVDAGLTLVRIYAGIVALLLLRLAYDVFVLWRLKASATALPLQVVTELDRCRQQCRVSRRLRYAASGNIDAPVFVGLFRPVLLLPVSMAESVRAGELRLIAAHELAHAHRRDDWSTLIERVVGALFVFNPVVHWISARISFERELACDEWAIARTRVDAHQYVQTLLHAGERAVRTRRLAYASALDGSSLRRRIEHLLAHQGDTTKRRFARLGIATFGLLGIVSVIGAAPALSIVARVPTGATITDKLAHSAIIEVPGGVARGEPGLRLNDAFDALESAGFNGAVLVALDGVVLLERGFGLADRNTKWRNAATTRFQAGAIAKMLTAAAILKLEEQGKLNVHDPLSHWFGAMPAPKDQITLHHLLTQSAGLTRLGEPVYRADRAQFIADLRRAPAEFTPGTRQRHTDIGYSALAAVVELASGMSYEKFVRTELLEPAGMIDTWFEPEAPAAGTAVEYSESFVTSTAVGRRDYVWGRRGAMGVVSTVRDLFRWHSALESGRLLNDRARARIYSVDVHNTWGTITGYGGQTRVTARGARVHELLSGWPGNSVELAYDPEARLAIALFISNRVDWDAPRHDAIARIALGSNDQAAARVQLLRTIHNW